jgi:hypothetical protein
MNTSKIPYMPYLIPRLVSGGTLRRADTRTVSETSEKRLDLWLRLGLARMSNTRVRKH